MIILAHRCFYVSSSFAGPELTSGPLSDLNLGDLLYYHMVGGPKSAVGDKMKNYANSAQQSFQVKHSLSLD